MFLISEEQMVALGQSAAARQDARMARVIGEALPELLPDAEPGQRRQQLLDWVDLGCERAAQLGIEEPGDMAVVVTLQLARTLLTADEQEKLRGWTRDPLKRKGSNGRVKVALVEFTLQRRARSDALAQRLLAVVARVRAAYEY